VKYEEVYLNDYEDYFSSRDRLEDYLYFYNNERRHMSLGRRTPAEVYWENQDPRKVIAYHPPFRFGLRPPLHDGWKDKKGRKRIHIKEHYFLS